MSPYGVPLRESLVAALRQDSAETLNVYEESIDRDRFDSAAYDRQLVAFYHAKYVNAAAPVLVITMTEPALDFALNHRSELFPHAALMFGAVDERLIGTRHLGPNVTGIFTRVSARATVETALALHPGTRHIVVIAGASRIDQGFVKVVEADLQAIGSRADVTYIIGKPLNDVLAAVAALRDDALVLFVSMQSDGDGVARTGAEVVEALRDATMAPIFGMSKSLLGYGIVGGVLLDMERHGTDLGRRARQILAGTQAADLVPMTSQNLIGFDWRELNRFGINEARIPAGATVVNFELTLWQRYKAAILLVGAALVGQCLMLSGFLVQSRRRRSAEFALQTLSGRLLSAHEEERHRIARELHDNLSQQMALLSIEIEQVTAQSVHSPTALARSMRHIGERTAEISTEIHVMSHRLHSSKLDALGLAAAVSGHCREVLAQGVQVQFSQVGVPESVPQDVQLCLFRIVQEALNNVVKHSGSHEARVTLCGTTDALMLSIVDFGCGFEEAETADRNGLGLASMRERLRLVGGELTVTSRAGEGTAIEARVPLAQRRGPSAPAESAQVA